MGCRSPLSDDRTVADDIAVPNADDRTGRDHFHVHHVRAIGPVVVERDAARRADDFTHGGNHGGDAQADGRLTVLPLAGIDFGSQSHGRVSKGSRVSARYLYRVQSFYYFICTQHRTHVHLHKRTVYASSCEQLYSVRLNTIKSNT